MGNQIIGFCGYARSGKDYCSNALADNMKFLGNYHVVRYSMARPIKQHVNAMFGWDERHAEGSLKEVNDPFWGFSPRYAYQTFGTEWARTMLSDDIWVKFMQRAFEEECAKGKPTVFIISDIRFVNEAEAIKRLGGRLIGVYNRHVEPTRKGLLRRLEFPSGVRPHVSEKYIPVLRKEWCDRVIENNFHALFGKAGYETDEQINKLAAEVMVAVDVR